MQRFSPTDSGRPRSGSRSAPLVQALGTCLAKEIAVSPWFLSTPTGAGSTRTNDEPAELSVRRLGDDVAVASLATLLRVRVNDEPVEAVHRYTRVWSRRDGRWRVVGGQVAPMPGSAAGPPDPGGDVEP